MQGNFITYHFAILLISISDDLSICNVTSLYAINLTNASHLRDKKNNKIQI